MLTYFNYKEKGWELQDFAPLKTVTLAVGRNATGKSKMIKAIQNTTAFMQMKDNSLANKSFDVSMEIFFSDAEMTLKYGFKVNEGLVEKEQLIVNGKEFIKRSKNNAKYKGVKINPPSEKLVVQIRRDRELFPEIERLMLWAEGITSVSCSDINPFTITIPGRLFSPLTFSEVVDSLTNAEKKEVLNTARELGYDITEMTTIANADFKLVQVKERDVSKKMIDLQLSSGMLRTIYLLCFMQIIKHNKKISLLLIDDLGEGLDYRRSIQLGKLIFEDCAKNNLQLIASSNDAFLMDAVDIGNWQILRRNNGKVSVINQTNNPELFRKFRITGLSNFDLFSSDFIDKFLASQVKADE